MSQLVAIDPDTKAPGVACFDGAGLCLAEAVELEKAIRMTKSGFAVAIEMPQQYGREGDQRDFLAVARVVGRFEQAAIERGVVPRIVLPHEWKGQTPKRVMSRRVWDALSKAERAHVNISLQARKKLDAGHGVESGKASDALDAVGIGLWLLGRLPGKHRA